MNSILQDTLANITSLLLFLTTQLRAEAVNSSIRWNVQQDHFDSISAHI